MLDTPIPVDKTEICFSPKVPVCVTNSLLFFLISMESKYFETKGTLLGSPTTIIKSAISVGRSFRW